MGGYPLLLVHGWPETKRIWWRNIEPLAEAGFEVIVPDLRGFGDSGLAPDGFYDPAAQRDRPATALVHDVLGHERCAAAGGDLGGVAIQDLGLRFDGFVERQCLFNTVLPLLPDDYERAGIPPRISRETRGRGRLLPAAGTRGGRAGRRARHARAPAPLHRAVLRIPLLGRAGQPSTATRRDFMTEPFADADKLRASFGVYETALGTRPVSEPPRLLEKNPLPTLVLYGPDDHVDPARLPGALRGRLHRASSARSSCRAPATSCSGSGPTS